MLLFYLVVLLLSYLIPELSLMFDRSTVNDNAESFINPTPVSVACRVIDWLALVEMFLFEIAVNTCFIKQ
jgi:hypothetical protein